MDNDETHYPNASAEAIRAYYDCPRLGSVSDVRSWPTGDMRGAELLLRKLTIEPHFAGRKFLI